MASQDPKKLGNNTGSSILPVFPPQVDFIGPDYSYADEMPLPNEVGVRKGNTLSSVTDSVKGVAYYSDMIGFGEASNPLTRSMGKKPFPMGVNYFMRTMTKCSNGADMWTYINGIPEGTALGKRVRDAMQGLGMPALRGLAPGMLEDAQAALNPTPVLNSLLGTGYAKCKQVRLPVGDNFGRLRSVENKEWIRPLFPGDIQTVGGRPTQSRWIFDRWMTQDEWQKEYDTREFCPDGSRIANHSDKDCGKPLLKAEGFSDYEDGVSNTLLTAAILLSLGAVLAVRYTSS
jgi:hypothetical protein